MNHRERILASIRHQPVDRIAVDFWATVEVQEMLFDYFGITTGKDEPEPWITLLGGALSRTLEATLLLFDRLGVDGTFAIKPPYIGPPTPDDGTYLENEWGVGRRRQHYATGTYLEIIHNPLAAAETVADVDAYRWPDPDWYDYGALPALAARCEGRALCCGYSSAFFYHNQLRGLERSILDPYLYPDLTCHIMERISDFFTEYHRRCYEATRGLVDMTQFADDYGTQDGLFMKPAVFDEFYRPTMQRAIDLAKAYGLHFFHHDDGDIRKLLPRFAEMGVDILNPVQWRCGHWDLHALKAEFGKAFCFHSAVDNQQTLPFQTPDEVRRQVKWLIQALARDGTGYIVGPCHNLQPVTPVANILALYAAAQDYGAL